MKTIIILALLSSVVLTSCNEDKSLPLTNENDFEVNDLNFNRPDGFSIENSNNPFDFIGQIHNEILNEYKYRKVKDTSIAEIKESVKEIALDNKNFLSILGNNEYLVVDDSLIYAGIADYQNNFSTVIDSLPTSIKSKNGLKGLLNFVMTFEGSYYEYYSEIFLLEETVLGNKSLNLKEKEIILSAVATARYSFDYWFESLKVDGIGLAYDEDINLAGRGKGLGILIIVGCDALGAGAGGLFGGLPGAVAIGSTASLIGGSFAGGY